MKQTLTKEKLLEDFNSFKTKNKILDPEEIKLKLPDYSYTPECDVAVGLLEEMKSGNDVRKLCYSFTRSVLFTNKISFSLSSSMLKEIFYKCPISHEVPYDRKASYYYRALTGYAVKDHSFFKILRKSAKNGKKPAIVCAYNCMILNSLDLDPYSIENCFLSIRAEVPETFKASQMKDISIDEFQQKVDRYLESLSEVL